VAIHELIDLQASFIVTLAFFQCLRIWPIVSKLDISVNSLILFPVTGKIAGLILH